MVFLIPALVIIVNLAIFWGVATKFEKIANIKGHRGYFWWCFWLGPIGWAMVIALPDRKVSFPDGSKSVSQSAQQAASGSDDALPEL